MCVCCVSVCVCVLHVLRHCVLKTEYFQPQVVIILTGRPKEHNVSIFPGTHKIP